MNRSVKIFLALLICLVTFTTCKKYSEDGKRSWHKPEKRIIGNWYLKEFVVDGIESAYKWNEYHTSDITDTIRWQLMNTRFSFDNEKGELDVVIYDTNVYINNSLNCIVRYIYTVNEWDLKAKKKQLYFDSKYSYKKQNMAYPLAVFSIFGDVSDIWNIQKLTDKELILEGYSNANKHLRIKLQR